jgi:hypothetical protein
MSSSGWKEEIYNPSERALSSDLMRMQRFKGADAAEIWRKQIQDTRGTDDSLAGGGALPLTITTTAPVSAEVHGGLLVRPQNGSLSLFVDDGIVTLIDPDSPENPDESIYKFVRDPGISVLGTLLMTANPAGSIRIDIIECARTGSPDLILETDNRDIFNPITGLFAPATVSKVSAGRLQYRVRAGVAGAGFPGLVAGWLPLAVVSNPPASTSNDDMTFWDVRPLISDRVWAPFKNAYTNPRLRRNYISIDRTAVAGKAFLIGQVDASVHFANNGVDVGWYRLGGTMNRGTPGTDGTCDLNDAANQSGALASPCYVYLLEPYGLPRWARYLDSIAGTRVPRSPRGIPVVTTIAPVALTNAPSAPRLHGTHHRNAGGRLHRLHGLRGRHRLGSSDQRGG